MRSVMSRGAVFNLPGLRFCSWLAGRLKTCPTAENDQSDFLRPREPPGGEARAAPGKRLAEREALFPRQASIDPVAKRFHLRFCQRFTFWRHSFRIVRRSDASNQLAFVAFAKQHHSATFTAGEQRLSRVDRESAFALRPRMAFGAAFAEDRLDVVSEVDLGGQACRNLGQTCQTTNGKRICRIETSCETEFSIRENDTQTSAHGSRSE